MTQASLLQNIFLKNAVNIGSEHFIQVVFTSVDKYKWRQTLVASKEENVHTGPKILPHPAWLP